MLEAVGSETPAAVDRRVDVAWPLRAFNGDFDTHSDSGPVGPNTFQPECNPAIPVPRVFEQHVSRDISLMRPTHDRVDVLITVVVEIAERDAVSFLDMSESS